MAVAVAQRTADRLSKPLPLLLDILLPAGNACKVERLLIPMVELLLPPPLLARMVCGRTKGCHQSKYARSTWSTTLGWVVLPPYPSTRYHSSH